MIFASPTYEVTRSSTHYVDGIRKLRQIESAGENQPSIGRPPDGRFLGKVSLIQS